MIYNRILSLFISFIMLFNLTADIFAAPNMVSKEQQNQITNTLNDVYVKSQNKTSSTSHAQNIRNRYKNAKEKYAIALVKYKKFEEIQAMAEIILNSDASKDQELEELTDQIFYETIETYKMNPQLYEKIITEKIEQLLKEANPELLNKYQGEILTKTNLRMSFHILIYELFQDKIKGNPTDLPILSHSNFKSTLSYILFGFDLKMDLRSQKDRLNKYYTFEQNLKDAQKAYYEAEESLLSYLQYAYNAELNYRIEEQCQKAQNYYKHISEGYSNIKNGQLFMSPNFYLSAAQKQDSNIQSLTKWDTEVYKRCNSGIVYLDENFTEDTPFKNGWITPDEFLTLLAQEYYEEYLPESKKIYEDTWLTPYYSVIYEGQKNLLKQNYIINKGKEKGKEIFLLLLADYDLGYMQYITTLAKISLAKRAYQYLFEQEDNDTLAYPEKISVQGYKIDRYYYQRYANTEKQERISKANIFDLVDRTENYALGHLIELSAGLVKAMYLENKTPIQYLEQIGITKQDILDAYNNYKQQQLDLLEQREAKIVEKNTKNPNLMSALDRAEIFKDRIETESQLKNDQELATAIAQLGDIDYTGITKQNLYLQYIHKNLGELALDFLFIWAPSTHIANYQNKQIAKSEYNRIITHQDSHNRPIFKQLLTLLSEHNLGWTKGLNPIVNDILKDCNSSEDRLASDRENLFFLTELAVTHEAADKEIRAKLINESTRTQNAEGAAHGAGFVLLIGADVIVGKALALARASKFARKIKTQIKNLKYIKKIEATADKLDAFAKTRREARNAKKIEKTSSKNANKIFEKLSNESSSGKALTNEEKSLSKQNKPALLSQEKEQIPQQTAENIPSSPSPAGNKSNNNVMDNLKNQVKKSYNTLKKQVIKGLIIIQLFNPLALSSSEAKTIAKNTNNIENVVQEVKNEKQLINALDSNAASLEKNVNKDVWISDRPNSSTTKPREKEVSLPKQQNTEGGTGPKPNFFRENPKPTKSKKGKKVKKSSVEVKTKNQLAEEAKNKPPTEINSPKGNESFVQEMKQGQLEKVGEINKKDIGITAEELQEQVDGIVRTYQEKGAIVYEEDLRNIITSEKGPGGLLENVIVPEKLNTNTWGTFYQDLKYAINKGDIGAKEFHDRYLSNMLEPDSMIVFDHHMNIPGMNPEYKTAMSIEKIIGAQSNKPILVLTNDGLKVVNAHTEPVARNIHKILTGDVKCVFERQEAGKQVRNFVVLDWNERNVPNAIILETDHAKGVNVIVTNYHPKNSNGFIKELNKVVETDGTSRNLYRKALYIDEESARILNNLSNP